MKIRILLITIVFFASLVVSCGLKKINPVGIWSAKYDGRTIDKIYINKGNAGYYEVSFCFKNSCGYPELYRLDGNTLRPSSTLPSNNLIFSFWGNKMTFKTLIMEKQFNRMN